MQLAPGQNVPLVGDALTVSVTGPVDLTALVLGADGKVAGDADMVFFNQPRGAGVTLDGRRLDVALDALRPGAEEIALVASPEREDARFGELPAPAITVRHGGDELTFRPAGLSTETALVLCSAYRRGGAWKLRAVGQGYATGLAGVAVDYGIEVEEEAPEAPEPAPGPTPVAPAPAPLDLGKQPLGTLDLTKRGSAVIPLTEADAGALRITATLKWTGRTGGGSSDLDFSALYVDGAGQEGLVHHGDLGSLTGEPWIRLDHDSRGAGAEKIEIIAGKHPYVLLCAYSAVGNGFGSFTAYDAHVVVDDGRGSTITVPLFGKNKFSYWVAIALVDATGPDGLRVTQVETYGKSFSERRPVLRADGTFRMSKGPIELKR